MSKKMRRIGIVFGFFLMGGCTFSLPPPSRVLNLPPERVRTLELNLPPKELLKEIARDTWGFFRDMVDRKTHLPMNWVEISSRLKVGDYASPTDIGLYLVSVISACDFGFLPPKEAKERIRNTLRTIQRMKKYRGFLYNYYRTSTLRPTTDFISSLDNGWLLLSLVVVRQSFPELKNLVAEIVEKMDFSFFYDPELGWLRHGYEPKKRRFSPYHYGILITEARAVSLILIGKGDLPLEHWFKIYRTLPPDWTWQNQTPRGRWVEYMGVRIFQGWYSFRGMKILPSWGGSLFEFLMPLLFIDEQGLAPGGLGENNRRALKAHILYARERGYPVWGLSPSSVPGGGYKEFGVKGIGIKGYGEAVVTPHVSFLALLVEPSLALENIENFYHFFPGIYGPYGFYDSVNPETKEISPRYLSLDQGMSLIALNNYLHRKIVQKRVLSDPFGKYIKFLLSLEELFPEKK